MHAPLVVLQHAVGRTQSCGRHAVAPPGSATVPSGQFCPGSTIEQTPLVVLQHAVGCGQELGEHVPLGARGEVAVPDGQFCPVSTSVHAPVPILQHATGCWQGFGEQTEPRPLNVPPSVARHSFEETSMHVCSFANRPQQAPTHDCGEHVFPEARVGHPVKPFTIEHDPSGKQQANGCRQPLTGEHEVSPGSGKNVSPERLPQFALERITHAPLLRPQHTTVPPSCSCANAGIASIAIIRPDTPRPRTDAGTRTSAGATRHSASARAASAMTIAMIGASTLVHRCNRFRSAASPSTRARSMRNP